MENREKMFNFIITKSRIGSLGEGVVGFRSMMFLTAIAAYRCFSTTLTEKKKKYGPYANPRPPQIQWTDQQKQIFAAISDGKSVFITGSGGTGKTLLLKHVIGQLKRIYGISRVAVTSSTGLAALALGGQTLYSFAGIGLGKGDRETLLHRVINDKKAYKRWNKIGALVIDEISMVDANVFDSLEYIARKAREEALGYKEKKWGGLQLVVSGDFFQLPPVTYQQHSEKPVFAFEADCWDSSFDFQVELLKVFRQSEVQLIKLLQGVRRGETSPEDLKLLEQCSSGAEPDPSAVQIYPLNEHVHRVNKKQMESLGGEIVVYRAVDSGKGPRMSQLKHGIAPDELELCIGARVMLSKNINRWKKLVNGATGTVIGFEEPEGIDEDFVLMCDKHWLPVVKFDSGQEHAVSPDIWAVMDGEEVVATRKQIPLILAWAVSIHKCQGMTLDRIHTDLSRAFGFGMVYVALSRVGSLGGLHLSGFDPSKIKAHPKVLDFYERFASEHKQDTADNKRSRISNFLDALKKHTNKGLKHCNIPFYVQLSTKSFKNSNFSKEEPSTHERARIEWTDEQSQILAAISDGKSVFFTGSAGTGKTFLMKHIIRRLESIHGESRVYVTSSTGLTACALDGQTLHSFAGIGLGEVNQEMLLKKVLKDKKAHRRWKKVSALVIDEIGMIDPDIFDSLEYIARKAREKALDYKEKKWGGIQLVVCGDFLQVPPVSNRHHPGTTKEFTFEAACWHSSFDLQMELTEIFRQSEGELIKLLQGVRKGEIDPEDIKLLEQCYSRDEPDPLVVQIYPRKEDVSRVNRKHMESLGEETVVFRAVDRGKKCWRRLLKLGIAPDELELCVGSRVMLIMNINASEKLVNGATGTVTSFYGPYDLPVVKFDFGLELVIYPEKWFVREKDRVVAIREQIPLILAWALSIHKCQGMTLNRVHTNLSRAFGFGMVYTALSRITSLDGLHLSGFDPSKIKAHPKVLQFYKMLR